MAIVLAANWSCVPPSVAHSLRATRELKQEQMGNAKRSRIRPWSNVSLRRSDSNPFFRRSTSVGILQITASKQDAATPVIDVANCVEDVIGCGVRAISERTVPATGILNARGECKGDETKGTFYFSGRRRQDESACSFAWRAPLPKLPHPAEPSPRTKLAFKIKGFTE